MVRIRGLERSANNNAGIVEIPPDNYGVNDRGTFRPLSTLIQRLPIIPVAVVITVAHDFSCYVDVAAEFASSR